MDLFVYGCTRVLRYFSLINHGVVLYYMKGILEELDISQNDLQQLRELDVRVKDLGKCMQLFLVDLGILLICLL
jgi:hypothetical protein